MNYPLIYRKTQHSIFNSDVLKEAERFFEWATSYDRKGLSAAADAMRDEGRKAMDRFLAEYLAS